MATDDKKVVIAGAGIGGLATALALARRGIACHVFERRARGSEPGAGIQIGPNGTKVLASLGVLDAIRPLAAEPDALSVHDGKTGRTLTQLPLGDWMRERFQAPYLCIHRQDLHALLLARAVVDSHITLSFGYDISTFATGDDGVVAMFPDGETFPARALIAADGLWSKLRSQLTGVPPLAPTGKCAYRTVLAREAVPPELADNNVHIWLSHGAHAVHYPVRGGKEIALVVIADNTATSEEWNRDPDADWLATPAAAAFAPALRELLSKASDWRMWSLQALTAPLESWTKGCTTLLGDAAHPVLPFFAQGGSLALEDAAVLAAHVADTASPMPARLLGYEASRRDRAQRVIAASRRNGQIYHLDGAFAAARNAALTHVPPQTLMRRYDWLYGWTP